MACRLWRFWNWLICTLGQVWAILVIDRDQKGPGYSGTVLGCVAVNCSSTFVAITNAVRPPQTISTNLPMAVRHSNTWSLHNRPHIFGWDFTIDPVSGRNISSTENEIRWTWKCTWQRNAISCRSGIHQPPREMRQGLNMCSEQLESCIIFSHLAWLGIYWHCLSVTWRILQLIKQI